MWRGREIILNSLANYFDVTRVETFTIYCISDKTEVSTPYTLLIFYINYHVFGCDKFKSFMAHVRLTRRDADATPRAVETKILSSHSV